MYWSTVIYWIFFWTVFYIIMNYLGKRHDKNLKKKEKWSEKEIQIIQSQPFSPFYWPIQIILIIASIFGGYFLGSSIHSWLNSTLIPLTSDKITIYYSDFSWFIYAMFFMFFTTILGLGVVLSTLALRFPTYGRDVAKSYTKFSAGKPKFEKDIKQSIRWLIILTGIVLPFLILSVNNYTYITTTEIHFNPFLSFTEEKYNWNEVNKTEVYLDMSRSHGGTRRIPFIIYKAITSNGDEIYLWKGDYGEEVEKIYFLLSSKNISLKLDEYSDISAAYLNERYHKATVSNPFILDILNRLQGK